MKFSLKKKCDGVNIFYYINKYTQEIGMECDSVTFQTNYKVKKKRMWDKDTNKCDVITIIRDVIRIQCDVISI